MTTTRTRPVPARFRKGDRVITSADMIGTVETTHASALTESRMYVRVRWDEPRFGAETSRIAPSELRFLTAAKAWGHGSARIRPTRFPS